MCGQTRSRLLLAVSHSDNHIAAAGRKDYSSNYAAPSYLLDEVSMD